MILTGIGQVATRGDLLDRAIPIQLPTIPQERRRPERDVLAQYDAIKGRVLAGLLDGVVSALRNQEAVGRLLAGKLPRMADFTIWATAAEAGLGLDPGSFYRAYEQNRTSVHVMALEASPVATAVQDLLEANNGQWTGTITQLHEILAHQAAERANRMDLPRTPRSLGDALRRLSPNLRGIGINCAESRTNTGKMWRLNKERTA